MSQRYVFYASEGSLRDETDEGWLPAGWYYWPRHADIPEGYPYGPYGPFSTQNEALADAGGAEEQS